MFICKHEVQYYETDRMGITHHSNYVRWMEEARTFFLREIGWPYEKIEEEGIISPVTSISCDYKATSTFADVISIEINVKSVKSSKLSFVYHIQPRQPHPMLENLLLAEYYIRSSTLLSHLEYYNQYKKLAK